MKVLVIGDSHTDIYKAVRFLCSSIDLVILRIPGITAQGLIKMEESTLHGGSTVVKFISSNMDADMIIFFIGSVDLDFVFYAKAAKQHSLTLAESSKTTQQVPMPSSPLSPSPSPSTSQTETSTFDNLLDAFETSLADETKGTAKPNTNTTNNNSNTNTTVSEDNANNTQSHVDTFSQKEEYTVREEAEYAADRFIQYLDKHILPIVPSIKIAVNSLHPPTLADSNNEGRLTNPSLMGNLYHSLTGLTFPPLPSHKERTEAVQLFNKLMKTEAEKRAICFIDVSTPMINPTSGILFPYFVRKLPFDVHIVEEMALPTYMSELQKADVRWVVDKWKQNRLQRIAKSIPQ